MSKVLPALATGEYSNGFFQHMVTIAFTVQKANAGHMGSSFIASVNPLHPDSLIEGLVINLQWWPRFAIWLW
jgi:hypothetical protein